MQKIIFNIGKCEGAPFDLKFLPLNWSVSKSPERDNLIVVRSKNKLDDAQIEKLAKVVASVSRLPVLSISVQAGD